MRLTHLVLGAACLLTTVLAGFEDTTVALISPNYTEINLGDTLTLKCEFYNVDPEDVVIWKKGNDEPLFMDHDSALSDYRLDIEVTNTGARRVSAFSINPVEVRDDNTYYCGTMEMGTYLAMKVKVRVPPTAHIYPEHWPYTVLNMEPVSLRCSNNGNPTPTIHWSKEGGQIGSHVSMEGDTLRIPSVKKSDAGIYVCTASSSAGNATSKVDMRVHDPHVIIGEPSQPWVRSPVKYMPVEMGGFVNISCEYDGNPHPQLEWFFNGQRLNMNKESVRSSKLTQLAHRLANYSESILQINEASADYFGDYSCKAMNQHGSVSAVTFVTAMPSPPEISVDGTTLTMTAMAPNGIDEFALFFRKPEESGWLNKKSINVAKSDQTGEKTWSKQINLQDFLESGDFEIQVQARNSYGYGNKASGMLRVTVPEKSEMPTASSATVFTAAFMLVVLAI